MGINEWIRKINDFISQRGAFHEFVEMIDKMEVESSALLGNSDISSRYINALLMKVSNLLIGKYQFLLKHDYLLSAPFGVYWDPANGCPLHCPGCLHNSIIKKKIHPDWPSGFLDERVYENFLQQYGPYMTMIFFFNWGEPLLNKNTPKYIKMAKKYLLWTSLSSNFSTTFDAYALVLSGLDYLTVSIDGATEQSYMRYRKGGNFDLVVENVRKVVAAKKKHNSATPYISWQYLTFVHNMHEKEEAIQLARNLGVNDIRFGTPYDVSGIDPTIVVDKEGSAEIPIVNHDLKQETRQFHLQCGVLSTDFDDDSIGQWKDKIPHETMAANVNGQPCRWLYRLCAIDAHGRILPCCYAPRKDSEHEYFFSEINPDQVTDHFNSPYYSFARKSFLVSSESGLKDLARGVLDHKKKPYCIVCEDDKLKTNITDEHIANYLRKINKFDILSEESIQCIADCGE